MKKLILTAILSIMIVLLMFVTNSLEINDVDIENEIILVEAELLQSELHKKIRINPTPNLVEVALQEVEQKMAEIESIEDEMEWFIAYKGIINEYYGILDSPETIYDYFTEEEIYLIQRVVETETYDKDFIPKANVANTVLSRYWDGRFGNTIQEIVTNPKQFVYGRKNITESTILAVEYAFMFETDYEGSLYFQSGGYMETFNSAEYMGFDGCHYFYK